MGFLKEVYTNGETSLIVSFRDNMPNSLSYFNGDSVEEAIKYFDLTLQDNTLYSLSNNDIAMKQLDILPGDANNFRSQVDILLANLNDEDALENVVLFPIWKIGQEYKVDQRIRFRNVLYKVLQDHISQTSWAPDQTPSLFAKVLLIQEGVIPDWELPDSTNGYMTGDKVYYNGILWTSTADNNIWEPGVENAPWTQEVEETEIPADWAEGNSYLIGDRVMFEDFMYESVIDNNVWSPAGYPDGWQKIEV